MFRKLNDYFGLGEGFTIEKFLFWGFQLYCFVLCLLAKISEIYLTR
jgi:hypothetical protein